MAEETPASLEEIPDHRRTVALSPHPDEPAEVAKRVGVVEGKADVALLRVEAHEHQLLELSDRLSYLEEHLKTSLDQAVKELRPADQKHKSRKAGAA